MEVEDIHLFFSYLDTALDSTHRSQSTPAINACFVLSDAHRTYLIKLQETLKAPVQDTLKNSLPFFFDTLAVNLLNAKPIINIFSNIRKLFEDRFKAHLQYLPAASNLGLSWEQNLTQHPKASILGLTLRNPAWLAIAEHFWGLLKKAKRLHLITQATLEDVFPRTEKSEPDFSALFFPDLQAQYFAAKARFYTNKASHFSFKPIEREVLAYLMAPKADNGKPRSYKKEEMHPSSPLYIDYLLTTTGLGSPISKATFDQMWSVIETALSIIYGDLRPYTAPVKMLFEAEYKAEILDEYACAIAHRQIEVESMIPNEKYKEDAELLTKYIIFRNTVPDVYKTTAPILGDKEEALLLAYARLNNQTIEQVKKNLQDEIVARYAKLPERSKAEYQLELHITHFISEVYYKFSKKERNLLNNQLLFTHGLHFKKGESYDFVTVGFLMENIDFRLKKETSKNSCSVSTWLRLAILLMDYAPNRYFSAPVETAIKGYLTVYRERSLRRTATPVMNTKTANVRCKTRKSKTLPTGSKRNPGQNENLTPLNRVLNYVVNGFFGGGLEEEDERERPAKRPNSPASEISF